MDDENTSAAQQRLDAEARAHAHRLRERAPVDDRHDDREEVDR